jgi:hypothetical protein
MKQSRFVEAQVEAGDKQAEYGIPETEICRRVGVTEKAITLRENECAGMGVTGPKYAKTGRKNLNNKSLAV